jgi:nuclear mRNA export protein SAC3
MCAEFERVERVVQNDVWTEEMDQNHSVFSSANAQPDETRFVKKFRRAAAGLEEQLPSDLRPPHVLKATCDYLFNEVIGNAQALEKVHHFVWDRTRAIRNDFSIQQVTKPDDLRIAIDCYERIARFHIMSLHQLASQQRKYDKYDAQQEREQLDRTLLSLMQYYDDCRGRIELLNEAEFRAYCVIFQLQDPIPDLEDRAQSWPRHVLMDRRVRTALDLYAAACNTMDAQGPLKPRANHLIAQQDFQRFWTLVESERVSYLMSCVAEIYFNLVRRTALNALHTGCKQGASKWTEDWTFDLLCELFAFDDDDQIYTFCEAYGFSFKQRADGQQVLDLASVRAGGLPAPNVGLPKQWKSQLVEDKRFGRTLPSIINGLSVDQARQAGLTAEDDEMEMEDADDAVQEDIVRSAPFIEEENDSAADGDQLFVPAVPQAPEHKTGLFNPGRLSNGGHFNPPPKPNGGLFSSAPSTSGFDFGKPPGSTFGKPSIVSEHVKHRESTPEAPKPLFDFTARPASVPSKALFDFDANAGPAAKTDTPAAASEQPAAFTLGTLSFTPSTNQNTSAKQSEDSFFAPQSNSAQAKSASPQGPLAQLFPWDTKSASLSLNGDVGDANYPTAAIEVGPATETLPDFASKPFTFGASLQSPKATSPNHVAQPEHKAPQLQPPTSPTEKKVTPAVTASPSISAERRASIVKDHKPKKSSPLATSSVFEASGARAQSNSLQPSGTGDTASQPTDSQLLRRLANEVFFDQLSGFLNQFVDYTVQQTITRAQDQVRLETLLKQAIDFREAKLLHRYGKKWREVLWRNKSAARASKRRERARKSLHDLRSSAGSEMGSSFSRSRASTVDSIANERHNIDLMLQQTIRGGAPEESSALGRQAVSGDKRLISSSPEMLRASDRGHKRQKSTSHVSDRGRIVKPAVSDTRTDLLKRSSFLSCTSANAAAQANTSQTPYFRLKAMGIDPRMQIQEPRGTKRRLSAGVTSAPKASSPPSARPPAAYIGKATIDRTTMPPPTSAPKKEDPDDALFARLKAARDALAESEPMLRDIVTKEQELWRSLSASGSSNESPSMAKARAEARFRASRADVVTHSTLLHQSDVPAYRLRESRFVPRENYSRAIERAKEIRDSRSRETSRPESRFDDTNFDHSVSDFHAPPANHTEEIADPTQSSVKTQWQEDVAPNGPTYPELPQWEPPAPPKTNGSAFSDPQQPTWNFANIDPAFAPNITNSFDAFNGQSSPQNAARGDQVQWPGTTKNNATLDADMFAIEQPFGATVKDGFGNFTIPPEQVEDSLRQSFGYPAPPVQPAAWSPGAQSHGTPQPATRNNNHSASQAITLLSEEDDCEIEQSPYASSLAQQALTNGHATEHDVLDEPLTDGGYTPEQAVQESHQHNNQSATNPYAALADDYGGDTEDDDGRQQNTVESSTHGFADGDAPETPVSYEEYSDADEEASDGDIEDMEESESEEGYDEEDESTQVGRVRYEQEFDDAEEDFDGDEETEEESGHVQPRPGMWPAQTATPGQLQDVGGTAEEAIELSD